MLLASGLVIFGGKQTFTELSPLHRRKAYTCVSLIKYFPCGHTECSNKVKHLQIQIGANIHNWLQYIKHHVHVESELENIYNTMCL